VDKPRALSGKLKKIMKLGKGGWCWGGGVARNLREVTAARMLLYNETLMLLDKDISSSAPVS